MSGVEEQVAVAGGAHDRGAVRGRRTQTGPELGLLEVTTLRVQIAGDHLQRFAATRVERQIEPGDFGHAANADTVIETGDGDLVGLVENGRGRRHRRVGDRHGQ